MARIHTFWSATRSLAGSTKRWPSTCRCSMARPSTMCRAVGWSTPPKTSASEGRLSGSATTGAVSWWSSPASGTWKEQLIDRIGLPCWMAWTRRVENDRPSRIRSTLKVIGWVSSPGRMKYAWRECSRRSAPPSTARTVRPLATTPCART